MAAAGGGYDSGDCGAGGDVELGGLLDDGPDSS